ncbi:MotB family protein [Marinobacter caseinilyticus]|uniref:MotB family protein n=1 Tax=Marinobacter caseinilyticus TaxID=2692195 RepID=UPI00140C7258|nr:MotB family protein [Marinobacter caseinilyticus]
MDDLPEEAKPGIPAWVVTFADLMSLLMCFFVLLLSFSEIDAIKFKQIATELSKAFGVQRDVPVLEVPMGTSPVFDTFSPAPPQPTVLNEVRQTTAEQKPTLATGQSNTEQHIDRMIETKVDRTLTNVETVRQDAIHDGRVQVQKEQRRIVIRIEERGSFVSGSAEVIREFEDLLFEMSDLFENIPGTLTIEGHTDNVPIRGSNRFQSNWDLSAVRASSVANVLLENQAIDPQRLAVKGLAATQPRASNETAAERALNRRVEIIIDLSGPMQVEETRLRELMEKTATSIQPSLRLNLSPPSTSTGDIPW